MNVVVKPFIPCIYTSWIGSWPKVVFSASQAHHKDIVTPDKEGGRGGGGNDRKEGDREKACHWLHSSSKSSGGGGRDLTEFNTGRLRPEVQPLTLLYTILAEKVPLEYTFYWKKVPLSHTFFRKSCSHFHVVRNNWSEGAPAEHSFSRSLGSV